MNGRQRFVAPAIAVAVACGAVAWLVSANPRLLVSWHGWLHAGIASPASALAGSENPFFAGEPLPYYWVYHLVGGVIASILRINILHVFQLMALMSLAGVIAAAIAAGRSLYRSTAAGITIAVLAVAGLNPLGPTIAAAKSAMNGPSAIVETGPSAIASDVFVSNEEADRLMARPLLGAMYFSTDWRAGQNIVWFFDVSSRAPALALVLCMAWLFADPRRSAGRLVALGLVSAGAAAFNPLIGMALAPVLVIATLAVSNTSDSRLRVQVVVAGIIAAAPTYAHLFGAGGGELAAPKWMAIKAIAAAASFIVLAPLAFARDRAVDEDSGRRLRALAWTGVVMVIAAVLFALPEANEHNLANAAACLLAVPAGAWVGRASKRFSQTKRALLVGAVFAPVTACTLVAFSGREPLPFRIDNGALHRLLEGGAIDAFYVWARTTPTDAVFVVNPDRALKMSGNVSEIPAFTGRSLFVDRLSYLTQPHRDRELRENIARRLLTNQPLERGGAAYWREVAMRRPVFVVSVTPENPRDGEALGLRLGPPVFAQDFVYVYGLRTAR